VVNLKTLPGDTCSAAYAINNQSQIVSQSINVNGNSRAFLWQNGVMTDLNALIPANSNLTLVYADDINDAGEIVGQACVSSNRVCGSDSPDFLLVPMGQGASGKAPAGTAVLSDRVRQQLRPRSGAGMSVEPGSR
jgi:probable HAF family extracellular repeat protein